MPATCLIGHTGFVGGNLQRQFSFGELYHSSNIEQIRGKYFDVMVCSGVSAVKWQANRFPVEDRAAIDRLLRNLTTVSAARVILISTVDVYPRIEGIDELFDPHGIPNHAYGINRLYVEDTIRKSFPHAHIVRLPGLFGPGLKKNIIYDLLHDNNLEIINPRNRFQFYDVRRLWQDLQPVLHDGLKLVNFATEPIETSEIVRRYFPDKQIGSQAAAQIKYDMQTVYAERFGGSGGYLYSAEQVLTWLGDWILQLRKGVAA
jgi:hypothetical protein